MTLGLPSWAHEVVSEVARDSTAGDSGEPAGIVKVRVTERRLATQGRIPPSSCESFIRSGEKILISRAA